MSYVVIEGLIGAGKSTLTNHLCKELGWRMLAEPVEENPFLSKFYEDPKRWAFAMQAYMLQHRYKQQIVAAHSEVTCVLDRSLPGDRVFAKLHHRYGNMHDLEWKLYEEWYATMTAVRPPFLMVFLEVDPETAFARIQQRGRGIEAGIPIDYLRDLDNEYEHLIAQIEGGRHAWSRGIEVMRVPWNDDKKTDLLATPQFGDLVQSIKEYVRGG